MWADLVNDTSYGFDNLLPLFRKGVHYSPPNMAKRAANASAPAPHAFAYSKNDGPLEVGFDAYALPFSSWTKLAFEELGFRELEDFTSGTLLGTQYTPQPIAPDMTSSSSEASYLESSFASDRQNLIVYTRTMAKKIIFDSNKKATGVQVTSYGLPFTITANKEIVISCGAVDSPQILMVSGIGPAKTLSKYKIPIISDLPGVGQNLWDHFLFTITYQVNVRGAGRLNKPINYLEATAEYAVNRTGFLTNTGFEYVAWEKLPNASRSLLREAALRDLAQFPPDWPEIEFIVSDGQIYPSENSYGSMISALVAPLSRGNVTIISADTNDLPVFNPNWPTSPTDQKLAVQAFKRCRTVLETKAVPAASVQTDGEILEYIQKSATTVYHASCTCKMGVQSDMMAVMDSQARVFGVKGLRVVDASAFPILPPGHPSNTVYALAEKIAEEILSTH